MSKDEPGNLETADRSVAQPDGPECCDRCDTPTTDGDARTESLLDDGVFCSPTCAMQGAGK